MWAGEVGESGVGLASVARRSIAVQESYNIALGLGTEKQEKLRRDYLSPSNIWRWTFIHRYGAESVRFLLPTVASRPPYPAVETIPRDYHTVQRKCLMPSSSSLTPAPQHDLYFVQSSSAQAWILPLSPCAPSVARGSPDTIPAVCSTRDGWMAF